MPSFVYIFEKFWRLKNNYLRNSNLKVTKAGFCSFYFDLIYTRPRINIKTKISYCYKSRRCDLGPAYVLWYQRFISRNNHKTDKSGLEKYLISI